MDLGTSCALAPEPSARLDPVRGHCDVEDGTVRIRIPGEDGAGLHFHGRYAFDDGGRTVTLRSLDSDGQIMRLTRTPRSSWPTGHPL